MERHGSMGLRRNEAVGSARTMHRQGIVLAIVCALGGAAVAALLIDRDAGTDTAQVSDLQRRLAAVEGRVATPPAPARVAGPVERPSEGAKAPGADQPLQPREFAVPDEGTPSPLADAVADAERRRYEAGVFERVLAAEQVDVAASNTFVQGLKQAFGGAQELAGNQLIDAQCRASLCRMAVLHRSDEDVDAFLGSIGSLPGLENTDTYWQRELNADGSSVMTMYVARPGHPLPDYQMHPSAGLAARGDGP